MYAKMTLHKYMDNQDILFMQRTLFLSCANEKYYHFVIPFAFSILQTQSKEDIVEIFLESKEQFLHYNQKAVDLIQSISNKRLVLIEKSFKNVLPNTVRFIHEPDSKAEYVYISDVDIFFTDRNIATWHLNKIQETGQGFSNIVRPNSTRLTGLHFTKWDSMYPLPKNVQTGKKNDEMVLYDIVSKKTGNNPDKSLDMRYRPVHGIHSSPNRNIKGTGGKMHWGINPQRAKRWIELTNTKEWNEIYPLLMIQYKNIADSITQYSRELI